MPKVASGRLSTISLRRPSAYPMTVLLNVRLDVLRIEGLFANAVLVGQWCGVVLSVLRGSVEAGVAVVRRGMIHGSVEVDHVLGESECRALIESKMWINYY